MKCPNCGKTVEWKDNPARPFCSERCKLIDFGRWANEEYRVPVAETPTDEIESPPAPAAASVSDEADHQH
jgi:endogenous inhibitor of DNA gyrase (YacG/DUF329 family)